MKEVDLQALENFERYWVKRPLNGVRAEAGFPQLNNEEFAVQRQEVILFNTTTKAHQQREAWKSKSGGKNS